MNLVLFDFDGTLVDTVPAFAAAARAAAGDPEGGGVSTKEIQQMVAKSRSYGDLFESLGEVAPGTAGDRQHAAPDEVEKAFREAYPTHGKLYPGVYRLLMALEDEAVCGIVGSAPAPLLQEMIDYFGLDGYVAHMFSMDAKASALREALAAAIGREDVSPADTYWVSSRPVQLEIARELGLQTVYAAYGYGTASAASIDQRLDRLSGLFRLFS